jgi:glycosyltransferase involved in cell wall biosynthesis
MAATTYLTPVGTGRWGGTIAVLLRSGPSGWGRVARAIAAAEPAGLLERFRMAALAVAGAELVAVARAEGLSHVHVHSCADAANVALFARLLCGPSYSLTLHGPLSDYGSNQALKWQHAAFGVVITYGLEREVRAALDGALPPSVAVAPMGVDTDAFQRPSPYVPWDGSGPYRLFSCGRLNPSKGHDDLIRAVGRLRELGRDVRLEIAGEDEQGGQGYRRTLEAIIGEAGLADRVALLGAVSEDRVRDGLMAAHAFALASHAEPLGVAIMEAMSLAVPVIVTDAGGVPELVENAVSGLLVPPRSPERLASEVAALMDDPDRARRLSDQGRMRVVREFSSRRSAEVVALLLDRALGPQPGETTAQRTSRK